MDQVAPACSPSRHRLPLTGAEPQVHCEPEPGQCDHDAEKVLGYPPCQRRADPATSQEPERQRHHRCPAHGPVQDEDDRAGDIGHSQQHILESISWMSKATAARATRNGTIRSNTPAGVTSSRTAPATPPITASGAKRSSRRPCPSSSGREPNAEPGKHAMTATAFVTLGERRNAHRQQRWIRDQRGCTTGRANYASECSGTQQHPSITNRDPRQE